jgi:MoaA/NifB/PqqE/SkfB family radical SAM enzyme
VINILHGLKQNGVIDIRFTWWEFTQKDWWYEILSTAKKLWFIVSLNTNGVYDSLDIIEMLSALNLNQITISVDWRETSHNKLRLWFGNKNNFIEATDSIKKLSGLWCNIRINTVLNQLNIDDVPQLLDFAGTYCKEINFFAMRHIWNAINLKDDSLDRESFDNISKWISFAKRNYPSLHALYGHQVMNSTSISKNNPFNLKYWSPDGFTRFNLVDNGDIYAGWYTPYIKNNSSLLKLGNILKENYSLSKIWHFSPKLQWLRKESAKLKDICENCLLKWKSCPWGIFEMELQKAFGDIKRNPYCDKNLDFIDINSLPSI